MGKLDCSALCKFFVVLCMALSSASAAPKAMQQCRAASQKAHRSCLVSLPVAGEALG